MTDHRISAAAMDAVIAMGGYEFRLAMALRHESRIELEAARDKLAAAVAILDAALAEAAEQPATYTATPPADRARLWHFDPDRDGDWMEPPLGALDAI